MINYCHSCQQNYSFIVTLSFNRESTLLVADIRQFHPCIKQPYLLIVTSLAKD